MWEVPEEPMEIVADWIRDKFHVLIVNSIIDRTDEWKVGFSDAMQEIEIP